jgi:hypothetical protein
MNNPYLQVENQVDHDGHSHPHLPLGEYQSLLSFSWDVLNRGPSQDVVFLLELSFYKRPWFFVGAGIHYWESDEMGAYDGLLDDMGAAVVCDERNMKNVRNP